MREFSGRLINYQSVDAIKKVHINSISAGCCNLVEALTVCDEKVGKRKGQMRIQHLLIVQGCNQNMDGADLTDHSLSGYHSYIQKKYILSYTREVILINLIVCIIFVSPLLDAIRCQMSIASTLYNYPQKFFAYGMCCFYL